MKTTGFVLLVLAATLRATNAAEVSYSLCLRQDLGTVSSTPAFVVDLNVGITVPVAGFQVDYDNAGLNELIPDEVTLGPVLSSNGYSTAFGSAAATAFDFSLTEILPADNPDFVALSFAFSNASTITGKQFCIDEDGAGTVVSDVSANALTLDFLTSPCVLLPDVLVSLNANGLTLTIEILNVVPVAGSQFFFSGPSGFTVTGASNGDLTTAAGYPSPSFGAAGVLSFSLSGGSIPAQVTTSSYLRVSFDLPGEYCVSVDQSVISSPSGDGLLFAFDKNVTCFLLEELECPTAGTGDVNFDNTVNVQDVVAITNEILGLAAPFDECQILTADIIVDGVITVGDIVALISIILGTSTP